MSIQTEEVPKQQWADFCDEFSRRHQGSHASIEILGNSAIAELQARNMPLEGITLERRGEKDAVIIALGEDPSDHLTHVISDPVSIRLKRSEHGADEGVSIEAANGMRAVLFFRSPIQPEMLEGSCCADQNLLCVGTATGGVIADGIWRVA